MKRIFNSSTDSVIKALALKATLIAAVRLNRFAAMDVFSSMLKEIKQPDDGIAVAEMLREELAYYSRLAYQIPKNKLHPALHGVHDEATPDELR